MSNAAALTKLSNLIGTPVPTTGTPAVTDPKATSAAKTNEAPTTEAKETLGKTSSTVETAGSPGLDTTNVVDTETDTTNVVDPAPEGAQSSRFSALAKKEAKLVQEREAFKTEFETFTKEKEAFQPIKTQAEAIIAKANRFEELKKTDPIAALNSIGLDDTDIINLIAAHEDKPKETPEQIAARVTQEALDKDKKAREDNEKAEQDRRDKETIAQFKTKISETVKTNADKFEFCAHYGAVAEEVIYQTVANHLKETGEMITPEEAAERLEAYYEEEAEALSKLKKRAAKAEPVVAATEAGTSTPAQSSKAKAIPNTVTPTVATTTPRKETREEKRMRLENILRNGGTA